MKRISKVTKSLASLAMAVTLATVPVAHAQVMGLQGELLSGKLVLPSDGLGVGGIANTNGMWTNGMASVMLFFGDNPEPYGWFTLQFPRALFLPATDGFAERPICVESGAWTNDDYAAGYTNPDAPLLNIQQHAYDRVNYTQTFKWYAPGPIAARSTFEINLICPPKAGQKVAPLP